MEVSCQQGGVRRNVVPCSSYESPPGEGMLLNRKENKQLQAKKKYFVLEKPFCATAVILSITRFKRNAITLEIIL